MIKEGFGPEVTYIAEGSDGHLMVGRTALRNPHSPVQEAVAKVETDFNSHQLLVSALIEITEPLTYANAQALLDLAAACVELTGSH